MSRNLTKEIILAAAMGGWLSTPTLVWGQSGVDDRAQTTVGELRIAGLENYDIEVRYKRGQVQLSGRVNTQDEIDRATKAALLVEQVVNVENNLVAGPTDAQDAGSPSNELADGVDATPDVPTLDADHAASGDSSTFETKRKRNAIILAMFVAGIALTGLLLLIAAIVARGFLRKMARQSEAKRRAELVLPPDVASSAAEGAAAGEVDESVPFSERETEVT
jgi:hypothetical protein